MGKQTNNIDCATLFSNCLGVFQGGGCRAIAYVGAYSKAVENGISFSEVAGTSAGAIFAALIAAGATPEYLRKVAFSPELRNIPVLIKENRKANKKYSFIVGLNIMCAKIAMSFEKSKDFIKKTIVRRKKTDEEKDDWKLLKHPAVKNYIKSVRAIQHQYGIHDSDNIRRTVNKWLKEVTGIDNITFGQLKHPLNVFASDIINHKYKMWSTDNDDHKDIPVAQAVAASCCIPLYFNPVNHTDDKGETTLYVDGGLLSNRPDFISEKMPNYFQTLSFRLLSSKHEIDGIRNYFSSLIDTVIYGADALQHFMYASGKETFGEQQVNEVLIEDSGVSPTDFSELDEPTVEKLLKSGEKGMEAFIRKMNKRLATGTKFAVTPRRELNFREQMYNQVAFWSYEDHDEIIIADKNFDWVWPFFPTIVSWINRGTNITVFYDQNAFNDDDESQNAKKRLAECLGCKIEKSNSRSLIPGFYFMKKGANKCVVFEDIPDEDEKGKGEDKINAKVYNDSFDSLYIHIISRRLLTINKCEVPEKIRLIPAGENEIFDCLRTIEPYKNAKFKFETVNIDELKFLKDSIRSLKYKELRHIKHLYQEAKDNAEPKDKDKFKLYHPAKLILDNKESLMTPVIVERGSSGELVVIKGNTRCLKNHNEGANTIYAVVVENAEPLDKEIKRYSIKDMHLSEHKGRGYIDMKTSKFRYVDQAIRPDSTYLK